MELTAIILAGGKSSRMQFNKGELKLKGEFLINKQIKILKKYFSEIIVVTNTKLNFLSEDVVVLSDEIKEKGPLGGLYTGLNNSSNKFNYLIACDMPHINEEFLEFQIKTLKEINCDAIVTEYKGWVEPFNGFYSKKVIVNIEELILNSKKINLYKILNKINTHYIKESIARVFSNDLLMFKNLNTQEDLRSYLRTLGKITV